MKTEDNYFRGFPALWNIVALYLFAAGIDPVIAALVVAALVVLTFAPIHFVHPFRVRDYGSWLPVLALIWAFSTLALLIDLPAPARAILLAVSAISAFIIVGLGLWRTARGPKAQTRQQLPGGQRQHIGHCPVEGVRDQVARLESVVPVGGAQRPLDREGQSLDLAAFQAEMRLSEARREAGAQDLQLAILAGQAELDRVPVEFARRARPSPRRRRLRQARRCAAPSPRNRGEPASECARTCRGSSRALRGSRADRACG